MHFSYVTIFSTCILNIYNAMFLYFCLKCELLYYCYFGISDYIQLNIYTFHSIMWLSFHTISNIQLFFIICNLYNQYKIFSLFFCSGYLTNYFFWIHIFGFYTSRIFYRIFLFIPWFYRLWFFLCYVLIPVLTLLLYTPYTRVNVNTGMWFAWKPIKYNVNLKNPIFN